MYRALKKLDPEDLLSALFHRTQELFDPGERVIVCLDTSSITKPYARDMENLDKVVDKDRSGTVNGFTLISGIAVSGEEKGLCCHRVFSRQQEGYLSDNKEHEKEIRRAREVLDTHGIIWVADRGYDSEFFVELFLENQDHFVIRAHRNRVVRIRGQKESLKLMDWARSLKVMSVRKVRVKGRRKKATLTLSWGRFLYKGRELSVVKAHLSCFTHPMILVTDLFVDSPQNAFEIYQIYITRWTVEDYFKFIKECLGSESFQVRNWNSIQVLCAVVALAGGYIYSLGVNQKNRLIRLIADIGGWSGMKGHKPGKKVITRGLCRLLSSISLDEELERLRIDKKKLWKAIMWGTDDPDEIFKR